jgi:hypothetical protein
MGRITAKFEKKGSNNSKDLFELFIRAHLAHNMKFSVLFQICQCFFGEFGAIFSG